jgi:hypothetical protein
MTGTGFKIFIMFFLILVAGALGWIIYDSFFKKKFNGANKRKK